MRPVGTFCVMELSKTRIGEAVFSGCADNLAIIVAGKNYTADTIKDGLK